jgi:hypothetical protein
MRSIIMTGAAALALAACTGDGTFTNPFASLTDAQKVCAAEHAGLAVAGAVSAKIPLDAAFVGSAADDIASPVDDGGCGITGIAAVKPFILAAMAAVAAD